MWLSVLVLMIYDILKSLSKMLIQAKKGVYPKTPELRTVRAQTWLIFKFCSIFNKHKRKSQNSTLWKKAVLADH